LFYLKMHQVSHIETCWNRSEST